MKPFSMKVPARPAAVATGVPTRDGGGLSLLDEHPDPVAALIQPIDVDHDPDFAPALLDALDKIGVLAKDHPDFVRALGAAMRSMRYAFSTVALDPIADHGLPIPGSIVPPQLARQDARGGLLISQSAFRKLQAPSRSALLVHEGLLRKLGLNVPRATVRQVVLALFGTGLADSERVTRARAALDALDSGILRGGFHVKVKLHSGAFYAASLWIHHGNGSGTHYFSVNAEESAERAFSADLYRSLIENWPGSVPCLRNSTLRSWCEKKWIYDVTLSDAEALSLRPKDIDLVLFNGFPHAQDVRYEVWVNGVLRKNEPVQVSPKSTALVTVKDLYR